MGYVHGRLRYDFELDGIQIQQFLAVKPDRVGHRTASGTPCANGGRPDSFLWDGTRFLPLFICRPTPILFARAFRGCFFCNTDSMSATAPNYNHTVTACFVGYITQAVINNFMPLLFVTFAATLGIDMARLSALITVNFVTQLIVDVLAGKFVDRIGYKPCIIAAHLAALAGLLALGLLPTRVPDPYLAILAAIFLYALGGGLIEVMVSPIVEACPSEHKARR